jgi:hypothetical protein
MQMVRQYNHRTAFDRQFRHGLRIGKAKLPDVVDQGCAFPIVKTDSEEIGAARHAQTSVVCHAAKMPHQG